MGNGPQRRAPSVGPPHPHADRHGGSVPPRAMTHDMWFPEESRKRQRVLPPPPGLPGMPGRYLPPHMDDTRRAGQPFLPGPYHQLDSEAPVPSHGWDMPPAADPIYLRRRFTPLSQQFPTRASTEHQLSPTDNDPSPRVLRSRTLSSSSCPSADLAALDRETPSLLEVNAEGIPDPGRRRSEQRRPSRWKKYRQVRAEICLIKAVLFNALSML